MSLRSCLSLLLLLTNSVSITEASFDFIVRFYEFRNPLGLKCEVCDVGGLPSCCDDSQQNSEACTTSRPCVTGFVFLLRRFGSVNIDRTVVFPHFTPGNGGNSATFNEGPGGFLALSNPFTITNRSEWMGRVQFYIKALDRIESHGPEELTYPINHFLINLELKLGAAFTERTTYTGIYNISGLGFDMSFRVQCSENYYGPNCTTSCLAPGYDPSTNCTECLLNDQYQPTLPAIFGGVLGLSVILNIFLLIVAVVLVAKNRASSPSLPVQSSSAVNGGGGNQGTLDIEMKPNSLYGLTSDGIVTKPNEVYGVSVSSQSAIYEQVIP